MLREAQTAWRAGLLGRDPAAPLPFIAGDPARAAARFSIHRGTVMESLVGALAEAFPVTKKIATADNFRVLALAYIKAEPPARPVLADYGAGFADFIAGFAAAIRDLPCLPDLARLEWALHTGYFAADAPALTADALAALPQEALPGLALALHGAARVVTSHFPIWTVWRDETLPDPMPERPEAVLVVRPAARVDAFALAPGDTAFLGALAVGAPLEEAAGAAFAADPDFDFAAVLAAHLQRGTFAAQMFPTPT